MFENADSAPPRRRRLDRRARKLLLEFLEDRRLLAGDVDRPNDHSWSLWHNRLQPLDVNTDGLVTPLDALAVVNFLNRGRPQSVNAFVDPALGYYDTNNDGILAPLDALKIINYLNARPAGASEGPEPPVTWDGGGDGKSWSDARNWTGDVLPTASQDVLIDVLNQEITIEISGDRQARSIQSNENLFVRSGLLTTTSIVALDLTLGSGVGIAGLSGVPQSITVNDDLELQSGANPLTVTGAVTVNDEFRMAAGTTLTADGSTARLTASGNATISGGTIIARSGGRVSLPKATQYATLSSADHQTRVLRATGAGSRLELDGLTSISGGTNYNSHLTVEALNGGNISLPKVTQITDGTQGDQRFRSIDVRSDGAGSQIDLSRLAAFSDSYSGSAGGENRYSTLSATNGGSVLNGALTTLTGVHLIATGDSTIDTAQITGLVGGSALSLSKTGVTFDFSGLTAAEQAVINVDAASVAFPNIASLDGTSIFVSGGSNVAFPAVTSYTNTVPLDHLTRVLRSSGQGSRLDLGNVTRIVNGLRYNTNLNIEALAGGAIDLRKLPQLSDPSQGDQRFRSINVKSDGAGSQIDLSQLTSFADAYGGSVGSENRYSTLTATNGGSVLSAALTTLTGVHLIATGDSTIDTAQITGLVGGSALSLSKTGVTFDFRGLTAAEQAVINVDGASVSFPNIASLDGTSVLVSGGSNVAFPAVTRYSNSVPLDHLTRVLRSSGPGSRLDLGNVTQIVNGLRYNAHLNIEASAGGVIELGNMTQLEDLPQGDQRFRTIDVKSDGAGSRIDLSRLRSFSDSYGGSANSENRYSTLTATNGGSVLSGALATLNGVHVIADGDSAVDTAQITALTGYSALTLSKAGVTFDFSGLTAAEQAVITVDGASASFPNITSLDGTSVFVSGGSTVAFPNVTEYANTAQFDHLTRVLRATGQGSRLDLSGLTSIDNGLRYNTHLSIEASAGASVDLRNVVRITDPDQGDQRFRTVDLKVDGAGSLLDLSRLESFSDSYAGSASNENRYSTLAAQNSGIVRSGVLSTLVGVHLSISGEALVDTAQITAITGYGALSLTGSGGAPHFDFGALTDAPQSTLTINGATVDFTNLTRIDGANIFVSGGVTVAFPSVTSYVNDVAIDHLSRTLQVSGAGSVLDLGNVASITNGQRYNTHLNLQAMSGGQLRLGAVTTIVDPSSGDVRYRSVDVVADGPQSRVDLTSLTTFSDPYAGSTASENLFSTLATRNGGTIHAPNLRTLIGVNVSLTAPDSLELDTIETLQFGQLTLSGSGASYRFPMLAMVDGTNFMISGGASALLPAVTSITNAISYDHQTRTIQVTGAGSLLDLGNVTTITNGPRYNTHLAIQATAGGRLDLHNVTVIDDPASGDSRYRSIDLLADGSGSQIDLASLTTFNDVYAGSTTSENLFSSLTARNGSVISASRLTSLTGVNVSLTAPSGLTVDAIETVRFGQLTLSGTGTSYLFPNLRDVDGTNFAISGGATAAFPAVTSITNAISYDHQTRTIQVTGAGSLLELGNLTTITNGTRYNTHLAIQATAGGRLDLHNLTLIDDPTTGDSRFRSIDLLADGSGSRIDLSNLTAFNDIYAGTTGSENLFSSLTARNSGTITAPRLSSLTGVNISLTAPSGLTVDAIETVRFGQLTLSGTGTSYLFPNLRDVDGTNFTISGGATATFPAVTSITNGITFDHQTRTIQVTGAGSLLDLGNLTTITNGTRYNTHLAIQATAGGRLDLHRLTLIDDPNSGDGRLRSIDVLADGSGSQIDVSSLTTFNDVYAGTTSSENLFSSLTVRNGGLVTAPLLSTLNGVNVSLTATSGLQVDVIDSLRNGQLTLSGTGQRYGFSDLTNLDGSNILVSGGAIATFPNVTTIGNNAPIDHQTRTIQASGNGSFVDLAQVQSIVNGGRYNTHLGIQALGGGLVDLSNAASIGDRGTGELRLQSIDILADGASSLVALDGLTRFFDSSSGTTNSDKLFSTLTARNSGTIQLRAAGTEAFGVLATLQSGGMIGGSLEVASNSRLTGTGQVENLINQGLVTPGNTIGVTGDFTQTDSGRIEIEIGGLVPITNFDTLAIGGTLNAAGTVKVIRTNNFTPAQGDGFVVMSFADRTGLFDYQGLDFAANVQLAPNLTSTRLVFSIGFASGPYVTSLTASNSSVDPNGPYIDVTFSEPIDPRTVQRDDIVLVGPAGPAAFADPLALDDRPDAIRIPLSRVGFVAGTYQLTIGPDVLDYTGTKMNQDRDATNGEASDAFSGSVLVQLPDLVASQPNSGTTELSAGTGDTGARIQPYGPIHVGSIDHRTGKCDRGRLPGIDG